MSSLAEQYVPFANKHSKYYFDKFFHFHPYEEFQSAAYLALIEAEKSYNKDLGYGFAAYAGKIIHHKIMDYVTSKKRYDTHVEYLDIHEGELYNDDSNSEDSWLQTEEEAFETIEFFDMFKDFLFELKKDEHVLVVYRVKNPESTQKECACVLSEYFQKYYSQVTISNMLKRIQFKYSVYKQEAA